MNNNLGLAESFRDIRKGTPMKPWPCKRDFNGLPASQNYPTVLA